MLQRDKTHFKRAAGGRAGKKKKENRSFARWGGYLGGGLVGCEVGESDRPGGNVLGGLCSFQFAVQGKLPGLIACFRNPCSSIHSLYIGQGYRNVHERAGSN